MGKRLSQPMIRVLTNLRDGLGAGQHLHGQSQHGGHVKVMCALFRRGLIDRDNQLTDAGRKALACHPHPKGLT